MTKVSVIIPIYKVEKFIEKCAISLMEQTLEDIEYIFVDDCTPDKSMVVLKSVLDKYPCRDVKILRHEFNKGLAAARKTGLEVAQGKYIAHCDSDDWVEADMYASMFDIAELNSADIVACGFKLEDTECTKDIYYPYGEEDFEDIFNPQMFGWIYGAVWNKLIRRDLYLRYKIMPIEGINMWEDSVLTMRLRLCSNKTIIISDTYYHYWVGKRESSFFSRNDSNQVNEMEKAVIYLESYFKECSLDKIAEQLIIKLKILSKERLMSLPNREGFRRWKQIFPENDLRIWNLRDYSLVTKIKVTLVHFLPCSLAYLVFCLRKQHNGKKISNQNRRKTFLHKVDGDH